MWLVSRQWAGLLDGYRLAQGLDEQVQREWGKRVADAGRQARQRVEAEHSRRMERMEIACALVGHGIALGGGASSVLRMRPGMRTRRP